MPVTFMKGRELTREHLPSQQDLVLKPCMDDTNSLEREIESFPYVNHMFNNKFTIYICLQQINYPLHAYIRASENKNKEKSRKLQINQTSN